MLKHSELEFEQALYDVVHQVGTVELGKLLGIKPGYLRRMAIPHDREACFRARDLIATLNHAQQLLPAERALAPLNIMARALGHALYPLPSNPGSCSVILDVSSAARAFGDLGAESVAAVDPGSEAGVLVTRSEQRRIEAAGFALSGHVARIIASSRALARPREDSHA
ncbi:MAG: hypothetical protein KQH53_08415 [Desulfarculaceae bacterium]|nr:hypothetical protein [Desulfarculaceae bacterium]